MPSADLTARDRILDAASVRFRRLGFRHASVESITSAAGTGKGSLYLHYSSKEELYLDTVRRAVEGFVRAAEEAMTGVDRVPLRLRALVEVAIEHYERDDLLSAPLLDDRDLLTPDAAELARLLQRERVVELIRRTLAEGQRSGSIRVDLDLSAASVVLFESGWAIVRSNLTGELGMPLAVALSTLNSIVGHGTATLGPSRR